MADKVTRDITTPIGTICFPKVFESTRASKKDGTPSYEIQILIPKSDREGIRNILRAIKEVGEAKWGDKWKSVRSPLRDGDKEKDELTEDGKTKGEKYPERLGHVFINARSTKPVGVYGRDRSPITDPNAVYGGCKGKIAINLYSYSKEGNHGVAAGLNGVQKIADGEPFGASAPAVESMFDMLEEDDDLGLDETGEDEFAEEEVEETPAPAKKATAKKAPAKKAAAKKAAEVEPVEVDDEDEDLFEDLEDDL